MKVAKQIVERALDELQENMLLLSIGNIILNSLIIFVFVLLFSMLFDFDIFYALAPAALYFSASVVYSFLSEKYIPVEEKVPELKEQLRTAADNVYKINPIVDSLKEDVVRNMGKVRMSSFIDFNAIALRILFLTIVSIIVVVVAFMNINFDFSLNVPLIGKISTPGVRGAGQELVDLNLTYMEGNLSDILGDGSIALLGIEELQLTINPLASDVDINNIKKVGDSDFDPPQLPQEIYTSYDVAYNEKIAKENQKVVKNYFEQITE